MAVKSDEISHPPMPDDLFILNLGNQPFLIGTWNLWHVGTIYLGVFLLVAIPSLWIVYVSKYPLNDPNVNAIVTGIIIFVSISILIYAGIQKYLAWVKLTQMKRTGQILIGKITNVKTYIHHSAGQKGQGTRKSRVRYEFRIQWVKRWQPTQNIGRE